MRAPARIRAAIILLALVSRVTGSTPAGPSACPFRDDGTSLDLVLSSTLAHEAHAPVPSKFRVLSEVVDAARAVCGDDTFLFYAAAGGQTMFAPTDQAFEELFIELDRGLEEVLGNPTFLCGLIRYHLTVPCTAVNNALFGRSCGFLLTNDMVDAQPLETLFNDQALSAGLELTGAGSASSLLFVAISQAVTARKVRVDGYMKRGADVIVPNVVLCDTLAVHVVDTVLVPAAAFYSSIESVIASLPELSITAEAYFLTKPLRDSFLVPAQPLGVQTQTQTTQTTQTTTQTKTRSARRLQQFPFLGDVVIVPPLIPRGDLPLPFLPDVGMCEPGFVIPPEDVRTVFAPTDAAWKIFFKRVGLSKEQVFSDRELLLSTLQYSEVFASIETPPIGADGLLAGSRFFSYNLYPLEILQSSVVPELLFVLPIFGPGLDVLNFFDLVVDVTCVGNKRIFTIEGQRFAMLGRNQAVVLAPDLVACDGLIHIVDSVLITPALTTLRQLTLRPELSLFTQIVTAPGNELIAGDLDVVGSPGTIEQVVSGVAIFAPTNAAVVGTLAYLGYTPEDVLVPYIDPFIAFLIRQQLAQYHLVLDLVPRGGLLPQEDFRLCLLAETDVFDTRLAYPLLAKPCNIFLGFSIIKQVGIYIQGVRSLFSKTPPGLPDPLRSVFVEGRLNFGRVIVPDLVSSNGVVQVIDTMLIPPTAELGLTIYDRIARTPWLKVHEEILLLLGLEREFRGSCLPPGDASAFAPVDAAWLSFFAKLAFSKEAFLESFTAIMYDIMMFALLADRDEVAFDNLGIAADFVYPPLEPQYVSNQEVFPTVLTRYWQSPAAVQFLRYDTFDSKVSGGGSLITQVFVSGGVANEASFWNGTDQIDSVQLVNGGDDSYPGNRPNVAQIIPPETRTGQLALNGDLHVVDKVLLPNLVNSFCRAGDFEFYAGAAFASVIASTADLNGGVIDSIVPRGFAYDNCERLPCTYEVPGLYGRAGFRLSVEATVRFKHVLPLCDPWCDPTQYWWCIPCTGVYAQTILTIGGCAPYQTTSHCGGALSIWVTDAGEVRFGFQTFVESFSLLPVFFGGGMRVVDLSVPALGFKAHDKQVFKVLATYDGLCNCTKIYVNDKLRGIADPFDIGQYVFQPFENVAGNLRESITLGASKHSDLPVPPAPVYPPAAAVLAGTGGIGSNNLTAEELSGPNPYLNPKDWSVPAAGQYATYPADPVLVGRNPTQVYLPWKGNILSTSVWFDNGVRQGIRYPSTCVPPPFYDSPPFG